MHVFKECQVPDDSGNSFKLSLISYKCIGAYVRSQKEPKSGFRFMTPHLRFMLLQFSDSLLQINRFLRSGAAGTCCLLEDGSMSVAYTRFKTSSAEQSEFLAAEFALKLACGAPDRAGFSSDSWR